MPSTPTTWPERLHTRLRAPSWPAARWRSARWWGGLLLAGAWLACAAQPSPQPADPAALPPLPALGLNPQQVTVSGLSSGGYMAAQFEVAFARSVAGAAIVAGGPYGCAKGSVTTAALTCSCPYDTSQEAGPLGLVTSASRLMCLQLPPRVLAQRSAATIAGNRAHVDDQAALRRHRVWLYAGEDDPVVAPSIVDGLQQFYALAQVPARRIKRVNGPQAGHGMPLATAGQCSVTQSPYLNGCQIDGAGELLKWLYQRPRLQPGQAQVASLWRFDQRPYRRSGVFDSLDDSGWLYVPAACLASGARCALHVAFHGCEQGQSFPVNGQPFGPVFVEQAGYNRWAEAAGIVVLYPQVRASAGQTPGSPFAYNPKGCWDFWGYTSPGGDASLLSTSPPYARRDAPQMQAVKAMVNALLARP